MARLPWIRLYTEARTDKKIATLADDEHRCWLHLLCFSAEDEPRGVIDLSDPLIVALECSGGSEELLARTVEKLERLRIVTREDGFVSFDKFAERQYDKPSDAPDRVRDRVNRHRESKRDSAGV